MKAAMGQAFRGRTLGVRYPLRRWSVPHQSPAHIALRLPSTVGIRYASTSVRRSSNMARNTALGTVIVATSLLAYLYITDVRSSILHRWLLVPVLRNIHEDGEAAHDAATRALSLAYPFGLHPRERFDTDEVGDLEIEVLGHRLCNPIGTSAGIDKGAEVPDQLLALGSAYVEVGGITPLPQEGNPKPRLFRLISQSALINRFGLNSDGADRVAMRLRKRLRRYAYSIGFGLDEEAEARVLNGEAGVPPGSLVKGKLLAVQIAKNKMTPDDDIEAITNDYVCCVERLGKFADVIVVNVSSVSVDLATYLGHLSIKQTAQHRKSARPPTSGAVGKDTEWCCGRDQKDQSQNDPEGNGKG